MESHIIEKIEISNFRSIYHQVIDCKKLNIFSGLNDTGKSNILKALNLFFNNETDFQRNLNFSEDFSKIELAKAQKSSKSKQLIKIKVFFKIPKGYTTLKNEKELFVEKLFDRDNTISIKYSNESNIKII
jgi:AAA15 family ATPase/GTPase